MRNNNHAITSALFAQIQCSLDPAQYHVWRDKPFTLFGREGEKGVRVQPSISVFRRYTTTVTAGHPCLLVECWSPRIHPAKRAMLHQLYLADCLVEFLDIDAQRNIIMDWRPHNALIGRDFSEPFKLAVLDVNLDLTEFKTVSYKG